MRNHVTVLGVLYIVFNLFFLITALIILFIFAGSILLAHDREATTVLTIVGVAIVLFYCLLSLPGIIGGLGLLQHRAWARILVLILAIFNLVNVPFGTALGIYSLWVLLNSETAQLFDKNISSPTTKQVTP
jgi:membrane protease YdiL (CAAX protease family)